MARTSLLSKTSIDLKVFGNVTRHVIAVELKNEWLPHAHVHCIFFVITLKRTIAVVFCRKHYTLLLAQKYHTINLGEQCLISKHMIHKTWGIKLFCCLGFLGKGTFLLVGLSSFKRRVTVQKVGTTDWMNSSLLCKVIMIPGRFEVIAET